MSKLVEQHPVRLAEDGRSPLTLSAAPWSSGCGAADTLTKDNSRSARPKPILLPDGNFVSAVVLIRLAS